jgi:hypothetical protein
MKQRMAKGERRKKQLKTHLTLCSELKQWSRIQDSSALLRDWEWNGFDKFLKLIRSSSHFSALQCICDSSLCSCHFGLLIVKGQNDVVSGMRI